MRLPIGQLALVVVALFITRIEFVDGFGFGFDTLECKKCVDAASNYECNQMPSESCAPSMTMCKTSVYKAFDGSIKISKGCAKPSSCEYNDKNYCTPTLRDCEYCCDPSDDNDNCNVPSQLDNCNVPAADRVPITADNEEYCLQQDGCWDTDYCYEPLECGDGAEILSPPAKSGFECESCTDAPSDDECNAEFNEKCHPQRRACDVSVYLNDEGNFEIIKGCMDPDLCTDPGEFFYSLDGRSCYGCCLGDTCNVDSCFPDGERNTLPPSSGDDARGGGDYGSCRCYGDPHCTSFDKRHTKYQGTCTYTMVQNNCKDGFPDGEPTFEIWADFFKQNEEDEVSWVKAVYVKFHGYIICLRWGRKLFVNGVERHPLYWNAGTWIVVSQNHKDMILWTDFGLYLKYDGYGGLSIGLPRDDFMNDLCGFCGNFNDDKTDDWVIGPYEPCEANGNTPGAMTEDEILFGESWNNGADDDDTDCDDVCDEGEVPDPCDADFKRESGEELCDPIINEDRAFRECLLEIDPEDQEALFEACVFDVCAVGLNTSCIHLEKLAELCLEDYGIIIEGWREEFNCPINCPENMSFDPCADPCVATCMLPYPTEVDCAPFDDEACSEMCVCHDGYVWDGEKCIRPDDCPLFTTTTPTTTTPTTTTPTTTTPTTTTPTTTTPTTTTPTTTTPTTTTPTTTTPTTTTPTTTTPTTTTPTTTTPTTTTPTTTTPTTTTPTPLPCMCWVEGDPMIQGFDDERLLITDEQKSILSSGMNDIYDVCKFQVRVQTDDDYPGKPGQVYVNWVAFSFGVHKNAKKGSFRAIQIMQDHLLIRGQGIKGGEVHNVPYHYTTNGPNPITIWVEANGDHVTLQSDVCPYKLEFWRGGFDSKIKLSVGERYKEANGGQRMRGMCGDCNGVMDEQRLCDFTDVSNQPNKYTLISESCAEGKHQHKD